MDKMNWLYIILGTVALFVCVLVLTLLEKKDEDS